MNRYGQRKLRIKMHIEAWKNGKRLLCTTKRKKSSIRKEITVFQTQNPQKWFIAVIYGKARTADGTIQVIENSGEFATPEELLYALEVFTEKKLLDETEEWMKHCI